MIGVTLTAKTIQSAPNVNPCQDPRHLAAIRHGVPFECNVPYVPGPVRTIRVGAEPTYQCGRCERSGDDWTISEGDPIVPDCGRSHRGALIRERDSISKPVKR